MRRPVSVRWTPRARLRLASHLRVILEEDGPVVESKWARKLLNAPNILVENPLIGRMVPEIGREDIREIVVSPYRVIYRVSATICHVLSVRHCRQRTTTVRRL